MPKQLLSLDTTEQASSLSPLSADAVEISVKLCNLPPFSAVANQVLALSADPEVNIIHLAAALESDPAFAADVLFLANSSLFGFASRVQVVRHAIALLGIERIKALAVTAAMRSFIGSGGPCVHQCWRHSISSAIIAEQISSVFAITREVAYTVGLVHDLGRLGLLKSYPGKYSAVLGNSFESSDQVLPAERAVLGVDHVLAGAWLAKHWGFPKAFVQACEHHHSPLHPNEAELLQVVKLACRIADAIGFSAIQYKILPTYGQIIESLSPSLAHKFPSQESLCNKVETRLKAFE